ncbi:protein asteroid homolog 1-like [Cyprinodon tularosa]|uniref:protein asteroid homolog 1-like n=1 Tax=Cyprinodon tularosa TaxID=77115 RepID=UPI0018E2296C|nr:protein asteroid homolog 1-like [Cyprinodon tularosa]
MGVRGLDSFLKSQDGIYENLQFRSSRLVIDGCSLTYQLYFSSGLDQNHGGEYAAYENLIERFITALRTCKISPFVVLDGGSVISKAKTAVKRAKNRIHKSNRASMSGEHKDILPKLADIVFRQKLAQLQVPVAQSISESDQEIAALAAEWECPALSNDSDFYIVDLPKGFLPFSDFQWKQNGSLSFIPCRRYKSSTFCRLFRLQPQFLPTFAALAGNDYIEWEEINWDQFVPPGTEPHGRLRGLLHWLKRYQEPEEALEAALDLMGEPNEKKEEVLQRLHLGMKAYQLRPSALSRFFLHKELPEFPAQVAHRVPKWMLLALAQVCLSRFILDKMLKTFGEAVKQAMMEPGGTSNPDCRSQEPPLPSAQAVDRGAGVNEISRPIRQVMYGLLFGGKKLVHVEEFDKNEDNELISIEVKPEFTKTSKRLHLETLPEAELSDRLQVLLETLGVTEESLSLLPPELKLQAAVTCYWFRKAQPTPDFTELDALLLGMCIKNTPTSTAALKTEKSQKLEQNVVPAFKQWQTCLQDSIHLNQLLCFPLDEPDVARLYQGKLVHQLLHSMRSGGKPKTFLKGDGSSEKLYCSMLSMVLQHQGQKGQGAATRQQQSLKDLSTNVQLLSLQDDETEKEVQAAAAAAQRELDEQQLQLRPRHRTKERSNRCKNPELARKKDCRGWDLL